jgi:alpha-beta hydrolase superfamily lysophospholipase
MELFDAPVLVLQGTADTVTDPGLAQEFYKRVGSEVKCEMLQIEIDMCI